MPSGGLGRLLQRFACDPYGNLYTGLRACRGGLQGQSWYDWYVMIIHDLPETVRQPLQLLSCTTTLHLTCATHLAHLAGIGEAVARVETQLPTIRALLATFAVEHAATSNIGIFPTCPHSPLMGRFPGCEDSTCLGAPNVFGAPKSDAFQLTFRVTWALSHGSPGLEFPWSKFPGFLLAWASANSSCRISLAQDWPRSRMYHDPICFTYVRRQFLRTELVSFAQLLQVSLQALLVLAHERGQLPPEATKKRCQGP